MSNRESDSPHLHTPFSPSLISFTVSVDVKHHVYLLTVDFFVFFFTTFTSWLLCVSRAVRCKLLFSPDTEM